MSLHDDTLRLADAPGRPDPARLASLARVALRVARDLARRELAERAEQPAEPVTAAVLTPKRTVRQTDARERGRRGRTS